jgi:betaine-aldehyde dehydrogenase
VILQDKLYIDGRWLAAESGEMLAVVNPATAETFHHIASGGEADIQLAAKAADAALVSWRKTSGKEREQYLRRFAEQILIRLDELARLEVLDNGKPLPEAIWDIEDTAACFDYYATQAAQLDTRQGASIELPHEDFECHVRYEPVGVVGQIIPWNFPMLMAAWKVAPALAAGCTVILKPSELTPLTALVLGVIADDIGLPPGVLNIVTGTGAKAGASLGSNALVRKLAFTGSVPTGSLIMSAAAQDIKNISLELGGKSPFIVFDDCDIEAAVEWIMFGIFWNQGQVCSATSRLIVHEDIYDELADRLVQEVNKIPIGNGLEDGVLLGPLVSEGQYQKVLGAIEQARREGARLLCGGGRPDKLDKGYFIQPTVFTDVDTGSSLWREEIFGPVVCLVPFSTEDQALALANDSEYGLAGAVMSRNLERCSRVANELDAGIIWVNCSQPTFVEAPWGGVKRSGIGRELGQWGIDNYLEPKQITRYTSSKPWGWYIK